MRNKIKVLWVGLFLTAFLLATVVASCSDPFGKFGNPLDPDNTGGGPDSGSALVATPSTSTVTIATTTIAVPLGTTTTTVPVPTTTVPATTTTVPATTTTTSTTLPVVTTTSTSTTSTTTTSTTSTSTSTTSTSTTSTTVPATTTTTSTSTTSTTVPATTTTTSTSTTSTTTTTTVPSGTLPDGTYKLTNFGTGRIQDAANSVGAKVYSSEVYDSTGAEKWTVTRSGGHYSIVNVGSTLKMGSTDGDKVTTGDANGNREQWEIVEDGIGRYRLINRHYNTLAQNENTGEDGEMKLDTFNPATANTFRWTFTAP